MRKVVFTTGALVIRLVLTSATALAQNIQGPGAPNYGVNSNAQTGGITSTAPNVTSPQPLYNSVPDDHGTQAEHRSKHAGTGHRR
jgi:hypothetical protein